MGDRRIFDELNSDSEQENNSEHETDAENEEESSLAQPERNAAIESSRTTADQFPKVERQQNVQKKDGKDQQILRCLACLEPVS